MEKLTKLQFEQGKPVDEIVKEQSKYFGLDVPLAWAIILKDKTDEERNQKILDLHLQCWTQQQIADELKVDQGLISKKIGEFMKNSKFTEIHKMSNFKPNPYNIWNYSKQGDTDTTVFGTLPQDEQQFSKPISVWSV